MNLKNLIVNECIMGIKEMEQEEPDEERKGTFLDLDDLDELGLSNLD